MNDPIDPMEVLDRRAAEAAADLHHRAAARPRPAFDRGDGAPAPEPRSTGRWAMGSRLRGVAAAAAVAAALAGGLWAFGGGDDDGDIAGIEAGRVGGYVAGEVLDGMDLLAVVDGSEGEADPPFEELGRGDLALFGPEVADPQLGIVAVESFETGDAGAPLQSDGGEVRPYDSPGLGRFVVLAEHGEETLVVISPTLGYDELAALVPSIEVDERRTATVALGALPSGWEALGVVAGGLGDASPAYLGQRGKGTRSALYGGPALASGELQQSYGAEGEFELVVVESIPGGDVDLHAPKVGVDGWEVAEVRGRPGWRATPAWPVFAEPMTLLSWVERPGEVIRVTGIGVSPEVVERFASSLRLAPEAEWATLVERTRLGTLAPRNEHDLVVEGAFEDGTPWTVRIPDGARPDAPPTDVRIALRVGLDGQRTSHSTDAMAPSFTAAELVIQEGRRFLAALVEQAVDRVELIGPDGSVAEVPIQREGGWSWVVAELAGDGLVELVTTATDGTELGRVTFGQDGSIGWEVEETRPPTTMAERSGD